MNFYLDAPFDDQHQRCICKWKRRWAEVYSESEFVPVYISKGTWPVSGEKGMAEKLFYISDKYFWVYPKKHIWFVNILFFVGGTTYNIVGGKNLVVYT